MAAIAVLPTRSVAQDQGSGNGVNVGPDFRRETEQVLDAYSELLVGNKLQESVQRADRILLQLKQRALRSEDEDVTRVEEAARAFDAQQKIELLLQQLEEQTRRAEQELANWPQRPKVIGKSLEQWGRRATDDPQSDARQLRLETIRAMTRFFEEG